MTEKEIFLKGRRRYRHLLYFGISAIIVVTLLSICSGRLNTTPLEVMQALLYPKMFPKIHDAVVLSRLPRLITSMFVGAALSISGLVYQELFNNQMASPDILGVSAGAGVGASFAIWLGFGFVLTGFMAFIMGSLTVALTICISRLFDGKNGNTLSLILSGIVISGFMNSVLGFLKYYSNDAQLASITFWLMGSFKDANYKQIVIACPVIFICLIFLFLMRWDVNMLRGGDQDAITHGINARIIRVSGITATTIMTALAICMSGTVGWIGLAIPNMIRLLVHNDGKYLFPLTLVYGIVFAEICDLLARTLKNTEIPVGIISGIIGAVIFTVVLLNQKRRNSI